MKKDNPGQTFKKRDNSDFSTKGLFGSSAFESLAL